MRRSGWLVLLGLAAVWAGAEESRLLNPTGRQYADEVVRLSTPAPGAAGTFVVKQDGQEIPYQVETIEGRARIWVCSSFEPGATRKYEIEAGAPQKAEPRVKVGQDGDARVLDNGLIAVRVPAAGTGEPRGPIAGFQADGKWIGGSFWKSSYKLKSFTSSVIGDGTVLGKVRLRYDFEGAAGVEGEIPAFAEVDVALGPGWKHAEISERHEMRRGDYWELELSRDWKPSQGASTPYSGGFSDPKPPSNRPLKPLFHKAMREDLFINLVPRWNQHFKEGWSFLASDGQAQAGAVVVRAGKWVWPHQNAVEAIVKSSGDYAGLRCPTWKGTRLWWLVNNAAPAGPGYLARYAWEGLDKLNHEMILEWPGKKGGFSGMNFYNDGQMNPTGALRGAGKSAVSSAGKAGGFGDLSRQQVMMHPDSYGNYWLFWSPENPNFFTDFYKVPIALTCNLKEHPRFEELRKQAELKFREDMYHSITLPGGAGQECPGYMSYAIEHLAALAQVCKQHLGFDPTTWDRYHAGKRFLDRISHPEGDRRLILHMGDTHPLKSRDAPADEVKNFATEELPGFGVIFNHRPGTPQETYLSFKSGPNRGHYHGDQLSFHFCADAGSLAVDHHCSYKPRAGQEHMHNRVAFFTDKLPYANMDGYERLIAFQKSPDADAAIGQVESDRLRAVAKFPPEVWHQEYPQSPLNPPLVYRRTVVFIKNGPKDYVVFRDQFWAPVELKAAFCLHVRSDKMEQKGQTVDFGKLALFCAQPQQFKLESLPWSHSNGGQESTQGARLEIAGRNGEFITVMCPAGTPAPGALPKGVKVGEDEIVFAGDQPSAGDATVHVTVKRGGKELLRIEGKDVNLDRSQGEIGLFVPDAGYPFGEIPDWLVKQRAKPPPWAGRTPK